MGRYTKRLPNRLPTCVRSTQRKVPRGRVDEDALTADIVALASQYGRYGYRRITAMLRDAGWVVNVKQVERMWRREGPKVLDVRVYRPHISRVSVSWVPEIVCHSNRRAEVSASASRAAFIRRVLLRLGQIVRNQAAESSVEFRFASGYGRNHSRLDDNLPKGFSTDIGAPLC